MFVGDNGLPLETKILRSSGSAILDSAAIEFSNTITYKPAELRGKKISSWTHLELRYKLREIEFDRRVWLTQVAELKRNIEKEENIHQKDVFLSRLFLKYIALDQWVKTSRGYDHKRTIRLALNNDTRERWKEILDDFPATFVLFDEFYNSYPDCDFLDDVKEKMIKLLIDTKYDIREKAQKSNRFLPKSLELIKMLDERMNELNKSDLVPPA